jgi:hypothetical protein
LSVPDRDRTFDPFVSEGNLKMSSECMVVWIGLAGSAPTGNGIVVGFEEAVAPDREGFSNRAFDSFLSKSDGRTQWSCRSETSLGHSECRREWPAFPAQMCGTGRDILSRILIILTLADECKNAKVQIGLAFM